MARALPSCASALRLLQCLIEIPEYIVQRLEADGETDHLRRDAGRALLVLAQLAMRRRRRMDHERLRVADVGEMREELHAFDEALARCRAADFSTPDAKRQDPAGAARQ